MRKRKILNLLMVLSIILIVLCGVMAVKSIKGPAAEPKAESMTNTEEEKETEFVHALLVQNKVGIVTVERSGIAYEVDENTEIRSGDIFQTKVSASVALMDGETERIVLSADTELKVADTEILSAELENGEIFADVRNWDKSLQLAADGVDVTTENAVFTMTAQPAAWTVYVYAGEISVTGNTIADSLTAKAGQMVSILQDTEGNVKADTADFEAEALSDAQLAKLQKCDLDETFCFTKETLAEIQTAREEEKEAAQQAQLLLEEQAKKELAQEQASYDQATAEYAEALEKAGVEVKTDEDGNIIVEEPKYCTIEIRCDTILDNMDNLAEGKEGYVPSSGKILSASKIMFEEGETVFDVLKRACDLTGIQLEYSYTPLYKSYYIEGINNLYEFDCGSQSGWMYKVNGWFPNYGCSSYNVKEGDTIVWCYTCKGLGADVGGSNY